MITITLCEEAWDAIENVLVYGAFKLDELRNLPTIETACKLMGLTVDEFQDYADEATFYATSLSTVLISKRAALAK